MKFHEIQRVMRDTLNASELGPVETAACIEGYESAGGEGAHGRRYTDVEAPRVASGLQKLGNDLLAVAYHIHFKYETAEGEYCTHCGEHIPSRECTCGENPIADEDAGKGISG